MSKVITHKPELKIEKFVKKPIPVEMVQITGHNIVKVAEWCGGEMFFCEPHGIDGFTKALAIKTREGEVYAYEGDFIAKGIEGEFYPIGKDIHEKTYDKVGDKEFKRAVYATYSTDGLGEKE